MAKKPFLMAHRKNLSTRPLVVGTLTAALSVSSQIKNAVHASVDVIELRLDTFKEIYRGPVAGSRFATVLLLEIIRASRCPVLLTLRSHTEQGRMVPPNEKLSDNVRLALLTPLLPLCDLVDVEIRRLDFARKITQLAHRKKVDVIHSAHDFKGPGHLKALSALAQTSRRMGGDVFKAAVTPSTNDELEKFLAWGGSLESPRKILIGMGAVGLISRVVAYSFGSILTYGHLGQSAAPGQMPAKELVKSIRAVYGPKNV